MNCLPGSCSLAAKCRHTPFHTSPCTCLDESYPLDPGTVSFYAASAHSKIDCHTATVTANQRAQAGIKNGLATNVAVALEFERSNWVNGLVTYDEFYCVPPDMADAPAGALLKLQKNANTSAYTVPPNTAISRFMFQTKTLNGSTVPGSAYILWPLLPWTQPNGGGYPVIGWAHGTSGGFGNCAPSHIRNLRYQFTTWCCKATLWWVWTIVDEDANILQTRVTRTIYFIWCKRRTRLSKSYQSIL